MAKLHYVKCARKDNKAAGIKKGESYYWWQFAFQPKRFSKEHPSRSELINSPFLTMAAFEDNTLGSVDADSDFETVKSDAESELEEMKSECEDKLDNMPEGLKEAPSGQTLQNRIDSIDDMISEINSIDTDIDEDLKGEKLEERKQEIAEEFSNISYGGE